jgi:tetratricopeptide (TPR) repeat protein
MDMGDPASAAAYYDVILAEVEIAPRDVSVASTEQMLEVDGIRGIGRHALLNRGVARLWQAQEQPGAPPDCATEPQPCLEARDDFAAALAIDGQDPATLINAAWAARLLGDRTQAGDFLAQTVTVDAALAPAWNDLGVLAAQDGNHDHARRAFAVALALDPSYDLPSWNLGILESGRGLPGWLPGQALLARAIAAAPALRTAPPTYAFDDRIYRLVVGAGPGAAEERTIGRAYGFGAAALGSIATLFGVGFILNQHLTGQTAGAITDLGQEPLRRAASTIQAWARRRWTLGVPGRTWRRWQPWLLTLPALAVTTAWTAWQGRGDAGGGALASALLATGIAVVGHELAHRFVARWRGARIGHGSWGPGIGLSLLLLPAGMSSGPYVGQRVRGLTADERWWVYVAGPLASALLAGVALVLFVAQPLPFFRVLAAAHLAVAAYALLPFTPLDGAALSRRHPAAVTALGLVVSTAGLALGLGAL